MKNLFYLLLLTLIFTACRSEKAPAIPTGASVVILGDSLSYGTGADKNEDYPSLLAASTGWSIVNAGVPGDTTADGLERLPDLLKQHQPTLLIIELGGNDFLHGVPKAQTIANLKAMIVDAKLKNISTLLVAIPEYSPLKAAVGGLSDHPLYKELAEETKVLLIEDVFSGVLSKNSLKADYIHPNAQGYRQVEEKMREALTALGLLQAK